ncbi:ATP-binding protein [Corynebacterium uterequi]|uniref:Putative transcriptional regulator with HTH domain n=1 Tax=Corynebacterium uterequi TaxID=1072256 RepID=A0A0G3HJT4_9CORY|nr:ATP-binding protein [Corynebacterium uterequi]AKK12188.1 putative transcriptional regulator with HTH domain [Corynebacterium uterequi]
MTWTMRQVLETLEELKRSKDATMAVECRRARSEMPLDLGPTLCAFANMPAGGVILFGVSEAEGYTITGAANPRQLFAQVADYTQQFIEPAPELRESYLSSGGFDVLVVEVHPLDPESKPATIEGRSYLRRPDGNFLLGPSDVRMLEIAALPSDERVDHGSRPVTGTSTALLDSSLVAAYLAAVRRDSPRMATVDDAQVLAATGITDVAGNITVAGLYALGFYPQGRIRGLGATGVVELPHDATEASTQRVQRFEGPLPVLLHDMCQWIEDSLQATRTPADGKSSDTTDIPASAIRELVANALLHRDISPLSEASGKEVTVKVTSQALVIENPGGLHGVSIDQLSGHERFQAAANPRLYEIVRRLHTDDGRPVIESEGAGIHSIFEATRDINLCPPRMEDTGVMFRALLLRSPRIDGQELVWVEDLPGFASTGQKELYVSLRRGHSWTKTEWIRHRASVPSAMGVGEVDTLVAWGLIRVDGDRIVLTGPSVTDNATSAGADALDAVGGTEGLRNLGRNVPAVYRALADGELSVRDVQQRTGLTTGQVRYSLKPLVHKGLVEMIGGQGARATTYRLATES